MLRVEVVHMSMSTAERLGDWSWWGSSSMRPDIIESLRHVCQMRGKAAVCMDRTQLRWLTCYRDYDLLNMNCSLTQAPSPAGWPAAATEVSYIDQSGGGLQNIPGSPTNERIVREHWHNRSGHVSGREELLLMECQEWRNFTPSCFLLNNCLKLQ